MDFSNIIAGAGQGAVSGGVPGAVIGGLLGAFSGGMSGGQAQQAVDPYAPYRAKAAEQLQALTSDPSSITNTPGFKFLQQQGQQGVERSMSARGMSMSGNEMLALQQQDQGLAAQQYQQQFNNLAMLSGASAGPAAGGAANIAQSNVQQQNQNQGLGSLGKLFGGTDWGTILNSKSTAPTNIAEGIW